MKRTLFASLLTLSFLLPAVAPTAAWADDVPSSPAEKRKKAKEEFEKGAAAYTRGDYETAVECWNKSYDLSQEPVIQQQLALAYGHLGRSKEERAALIKYRESARPEERPVLDQQIANLDARIKKQEEEEKARQEQEAALKKQLEDEKGKPKGGKSGASVPGIVITSVGVAAVIAGVAVDAAAAAQRPDEASVCKANGAGQVCLGSAKEDIDASNRMAIAGDVTWISGLAIAGAGAIILIVDRPKSAASTKKTGGVDVVPFAGVTKSTGATGGLTVRGSF
ncbi:MAG: hypothetical protein U0414_34115 [Polyangiaceae bacterium]